MSGINPNMASFMYGGVAPLGPQQTTENLIKAQDKFSNFLEFGGPGVVSEHVLGIPLPTQTINRKLGEWGARMMGYEKGQNPVQAMYYGTTYGAVGGVAPGAVGANFGAIGAGAPLPAPGQVVGAPLGGFGGQARSAVGMSAAPLNTIEGQLGGIRSIIQAGGELTQTQMLQYQELSNKQNQLFMFAQNILTSEHEKVKGWTQALGRI